MAIEHDVLEWEPLTELYQTMAPQLIERADRATHRPDFALPKNNVFDLRCIYPDELEAAICQDTALQAIQAQPAAHAYEVDDRAERIRTRRTVIALAALAWYHAGSPDDPSAGHTQQTAA